jgi:hypothetical protein
MVLSKQAALILNIHSLSLVNESLIACRPRFNGWSTPQVLAWNVIVIHARLRYLILIILVNVSVCDILGRKVSTLINEEEKHETIMWNFPPKTDPPPAEMQSIFQAGGTFIKSRREVF